MLSHLRQRFDIWIACLLVCIHLRYMYMYIYMCVCVCVCLALIDAVAPQTAFWHLDCLLVSMHTCQTCMYICACIHTHMYVTCIMLVCTSVRHICAYIHACMHVYMLHVSCWYVHYICAYTHTYHSKWMTDRQKTIRARAANVCKMLILTTYVAIFCVTTATKTPIHTHMRTCMFTDLVQNVQAALCPR
jgi:hypothetical protein